MDGRRSPHKRSYQDLPPTHPQNIYTQITTGQQQNTPPQYPSTNIYNTNIYGPPPHQSTTPHFPALNPSSQASSSQQAFHHQPQTSAQTSQHHQQIQNAIAQPMLSLDQINDLLSTLIGGPSEKIDPSIIQILSRIADEFVEDMAKGAAHLANLRNGTSVSVKDVRLYLEEEYGIKLSGYGGDAEEKAVMLKQEARSRAGSESHRQRVAAVKRMQHLGGHHHK